VEEPVRVVKVVGAAVVAVLGACGDRSGHDVKPLVPRARQDNEVIAISSINATVHGADSLRPPCPVYPHAEGRMVVRGVAGTIQYRWERSDGTAGPLTEIRVKASSSSGDTGVTLRPDDWKDDKRGVQLNIDERVHVTYPFDVHSAPVTLNVMCY